jgi:hypothetical protein
MKIDNYKRLLFLWLLLAFGVTHAQTKNEQLNPYHHDYSKTLVMKIMNATVNKDGSCHVVCTFAQTMGIIKKVDAITLGCPKILYLAGWQYNGHDDKYPAFFEVNRHLKRLQDSTALQSLHWLFAEARKYHTTISLHINMTDSYTNSPLWKEYETKNLISKNADGSLKVIGHYNGRDSYQINYKKEWEAGYSQMRIDSLLKLLPELRRSGTIHLDAWIARPSEGDSETVETEKEYQRMVCYYWSSKGIDVTTEMLLPYMIGMVPLAYHLYPEDRNFAVNDDFFLNIPANVFTATDFNPDVPQDVGLGFLFGTTMNAESIFPSRDDNRDAKWFLPSDKLVIPKGSWNDLRLKYWMNIFTNEFYLHCPQYFFLNRFKRLKVTGEGNNRIAYFSNNVEVILKDSTVKQNGYILREKNLIFFPVIWLNNKSYVLYSPISMNLTLNVPGAWKKARTIKIQMVTEDGLRRQADIQLNDSRLKIHLEGNKPLLLSI